MDQEELTVRTSWLSQGACRDHPDLNWFSEGVGMEAQAERRLVKDVCKFKCPVQSECLMWALAHEEYGTWGGTSERERKRLRKQMHIFLESPQRLTGEIRYGSVGGGASSAPVAFISDPQLRKYGATA